MLTADAIHKAVYCGEILISPYNPTNLAQISYDFTLASKVLVYSVKSPLFLSDIHVDTDGNPTERPFVLETRKPNLVEEFTIDQERGAVFVPGVLYLGATVEQFSSSVYGMTVHGRSSLGRLGIVLHQTAGLVEPGFEGVITLEITVTHPVRIFAGERIGQVCFHQLTGEVDLYQGKYQSACTAEASKLYKDHE